MKSDGMPVRAGVENGTAEASSRSEGEIIVARYSVLLTGLLAVAIVFPMIEGCCMTGTQNPIAAATAAAKILGDVEALQAATTQEEVLQAIDQISDTVAAMTTSEIASAVNLVAGQNWSLDDAQSIKDLAAQIDDEAIQALSQVELTDGNTDPNTIVDVLGGADVTVTDEQIDLLQGALNNLSADLGGTLGG